MGDHILELKLHLTLGEIEELGLILLNQTEYHLKRLRHDTTDWSVRMGRARLDILMNSHAQIADFIEDYRLSIAEGDSDE